MPRLYNGVRLLRTGPSLLNVRKIDMGATPMIVSMMQRGLEVDLSHFARMAVTLKQGMEEITESIHTLTGYRINIDSPIQVSDLLFKKLGLKQARRKLTAKGDESTEEEVLLAIQHEHQAIPKILEYKELSKLKGTYVDPMPRLARRSAFGVWRMYPNLGMTRVPSGRLNCKEPNLLAMPSRTWRGREIRKGFITQPGWVYVSVDESQIEVRVCADNSEDENLIRIYENEEDIYSDFAISAFSLEDTRFRDEKGKWQYPTVDKTEHRSPSKTCVLAAIYDVTEKGLLEQMPIICIHCRLPLTADKEGMKLHGPGTCDYTFAPLWTEDKCGQILAAFYRRYPGILQDRRRNHMRAKMKGYLWDMWGRILHVAATRSVIPYVQSSALREAGNFPYQSGAQGTIKLTMAEVHDDLIVSKMLGTVVHPLLQIHDELLFEVREDVAEELTGHVVSRFQTCAPLRVPIKAGGAIAKTWGDLEK